ncbi:hypothetical protein HYC85_002136 [Camellia sinensis]|uniref:Uncharacterized protein n=1 Tax=Camellia sinensis TaxID=4442 RepID=A0A7J7I8T9_CAMSI|nr:hypothetical protein HYC85_002136 [Camellia sinensis]
MEGMVKKYQQKFRKVIQNPKNYGALKCIAGIEDLVLRKQMESLESILLSMNQTLYILKASIVSALSALALKPSGSDLGALQQLLVDQPNIPKEEDNKGSSVAIFGSLEDTLGKTIQEMDNFFVSFDE